MNNLVASLDTLTNPMMIHKAQERYEAAQQELTRLSTLQTATNVEIAKMEAIERLKQDYGQVVEQWHTYDGDRKREVLQVFIDYIVVEPLPKSSVRLTIHWRDNSTDKIDVAPKAETFLGWLETDEQLLFTLVDRHATQVEIASAFPDRNWKTIRQKVYSVRGVGSLQVSPKPIDDDETYHEYDARTKNQVVQYKARHSERWLPEDIERLCKLLDADSTQLEIMEAFPHRRWEALRGKITELRGKDVRVRGMGKGEVKRPETYQMYKLRKQYEVGGNTQDDMTSQCHSNKNCRVRHG
jgi:hypothetical protein